MQIKGIMDECFSDYKKPAMYIAFPYCSFKCDEANKCKVCQNGDLARQPIIEISKEDLIKRYLNNKITEAFVFSGLEPMDTPLDVLALVSSIRTKFGCNDDIVIYTGYTEEELVSGNYNGEPTSVKADFWKELCSYPNVYVKFGRFLMNQESHFDPLLGINLASPNQYCKKISNV